MTAEEQKYIADEKHKCGYSIIAAMMNGVIAYFLQQEFFQWLKNLGGENE